MLAQGFFSGMLRPEPVRQQDPSLPAMAWRPLLAVFGAGAGRAVAARWAALFSGIAFPCAILLGGNGVHPRDVAGWFSTFATLRAVALVGFGLLTAPVVAPALLGPGTLELRSLPVGRRAVVALVAGSAALTELPVAVLLAVGGSPGAGLSLGLAAAVVALGLAGRVMTPRLIAAVGVSAALVIAGAPSAIAAPVCAAMLAIAGREAWVRAPEHGPRSRRRSLLVSGPAFVALSGAHWLRLARQEMPVVVRGLLLASGGGLAAALVARNVGAVTRSQVTVLSLTWGALPFAVAASGACGPVLDSERRLRWMIDASGATSAARHGGAALAMVGAGVMAGVAFIGAFMLVARLPLASAVRAAAASSAWGAALALVGLVWARASLRDESKDRARFVVGSAGLGAVLAFVSEATLAPTRGRSQRQGPAPGARRRRRAPRTKASGRRASMEGPDERDAGHRSARAPTMASAAPRPRAAKASGAEPSMIQRRRRSECGAGPAPARRSLPPQMGEPPT